MRGRAFSGETRTRYEERSSGTDRMKVKGKKNGGGRENFKKLWITVYFH